MAIHTLHDSNDRKSLLDRAARLTPEAAPRWGQMNAGQMMRHCVEALRSSLGEVTSKPLGRRLLHTRLAKYIIFRFVPMPRNAPTAPELRVTGPASLEAERERLVAYIGRYAAPPDDSLRAEHSLFGVLSREEWAVLEYKHIDHHLRQFGV